MSDDYLAARVQPRQRRITRMGVVPTEVIMAQAAIHAREISEYRMEHGQEEMNDEDDKQGNKNKNDDHIR